MGKMTHKDMKFVSKEWGYELWIVNNDRYCGKILFIKKGKNCSYHYHKIKDEVLYVQDGKIVFIHDDLLGKNKAFEILEAGDAWHVTPGIVHQMIAIEDTFIHEFSTQHFDEDSHRVCRDVQVTFRLDGSPCLETNG